MIPKLFYLSATVSFDAVPLPKDSSERKRALGIAHFYITAEEDIDAGACAQDMCRSMDLEFLDYLDLPAEETEATLHSADEHKIAFAEAKERGRSLVISRIFDADMQGVDPTTFLI